MRVIDRGWNGDEQIVLLGDLAWPDLTWPDLQKRKVTQ